MPDFLPALRQMLTAGASLQSAGRQLGISTSAAQRWIARYPALSKRRQAKRISGAKRERIRELRLHGKSTRQIAAAVGVSYQSVLRIIHESPKRFRCTECGGLNLQPECIPCSL